MIFSLPGKLLKIHGLFIIIFVLAFFLFIHDLIKAVLQFESLEISPNSATSTFVDTSSASYTNPALPRILSSEDKDLYREIFKLQGAEKWVQADEKIANLRNKILMGYVTGQRLLHPYYTPKKSELLSWFAKYSDHPQSYDVYKLALKKDPTFKPPQEITKDDHLKGYGDGRGLSRSIEYSLDKSYWKDRSEAYSVWKKIHYNIRRGNIGSMQLELASEKYKSLFTPLEIDMVKWSLSESYFARNKYDEAMKLAKDGLGRSGEKIPKVYWVAGISAWKMGQWSESASYFSTLASSSNASSWEKSAGGFWAHRAYKKLGDTTSARSMLEIASEHPRSFYGMLATISLGKTIPVDSSGPGQRISINSLLVIPNVKRALALYEIGNKKGAEGELRKAFPKTTMSLKKQILSLTKMLNLTGLEVKMATIISESESGYSDDSQYPIPTWRPDRGFTVNPALLFAFIRHESGFDPYAKSPVGAKGLMQLMPKTANYMAQKGNYRIDSSSLYIPEVNMSIGQDYLQYLLSNGDIDGNLVFLAAAYNAGPNNLAHWVNKTGSEIDPLLFIESIPSKETRNFVKHIMTNYWVYRTILGYQSPSINALLNNEWPVYEDYKPKKNKTKSYKIAMETSVQCPILN